MYFYLTRFDYFIDCLYEDYKIKPIHIMLPKTSVYVKSYDSELKQMLFLIEDNDLLKNYNAIWNKVSADIKKEYDSELAYNNTFSKTKVKSYGYEAIDFHNEKMPKARSNHTSLAVIRIDSAFKKSESYYLQVFLKG